MPYAIISQVNTFLNLFITPPAACGTSCSRHQHATGTTPDLTAQLQHFIRHLFNTADFPARWHCGNWTDLHGWLYIFSDLGIWAAYFAIPFLLLRLLLIRKDIPFHRFFYLFIGFILLCGLTHLMDAAIFWWPAYRLSALLRLLTAFVSLTTVIGLFRIFPAISHLRSITDLEDEIAKRTVMEDKLAASEYLLSEAGRIACVGGWEIDLIRGTRIWSKTVYDILELAYDRDIYQDTILSYYPSPYGEALEEAMREARVKGTKWDMEVLALTQGQKYIWVRHTGEPVFDARGKVVNLRGIVMDIDRYKNHELMLSASLSAAREKKQQLKNFSYVLSHNIRNHTSNLYALTGMMETDQLDEENKELIGKTRLVAVALTNTLDDLADVIRARDQHVDQEAVGFENTLNYTLQHLQPQLLQTAAEIRFHFDVELVNFPKVYLQNIFLQLLSNALRFRERDRQPQIAFRTFRNAQQQLTLQCTDNGTGMNLELFGHKLFNLYSTFHDKLSGRGAGLFLIKTQLESQGGQIGVESRPGEGSTFTVIFSG